MKHKRIWFKNRIGNEVWQEKKNKVFITPNTYFNGEFYNETILNKIEVTKQNVESLYLSQVEKHYKYFDI